MPAPTERVAPGQESHSFTPVSKDWIKRTNWYRPVWDPPESYEGVKEEDRKPDDKDLIREDRYFAHDGDAQPCKILRYYASGAVWQEIDDLNVGDRTLEQFDRWYYPDGSPRSFMHWKDGKWVDGGSVSPDGRVTHRFKDGAGELVEYGSKEGNRTHSWYLEGYPFLEKRYRDGACIRIRLNDGSDSFIASPGEKQLFLTGCHEAWSRRSGEEAALSANRPTPGHRPRRAGGGRSKDARAIPATTGRLHEGLREAAGESRQDLGRTEDRVYPRRRPLAGVTDYLTVKPRQTPP